MKAVAFAPATVANVAVGFDLLGFAVEGLGETAIVEKIIGSRQVVLNPVEGYPQIPLDPKKNTATAGLVRLIKDKKLDFGFRVTLKKNIPVGSGLGGSATSAVAALVAANSLLKKKLSREELLDYALTGEEVASHSRHADNIGPCLEGGLVFVGTSDSLVLQKVPTPASLRCVLLLPDISIRTSESRGGLHPEVSLKKMTQQMANMAGFLLGCMTKNIPMIKKFLKDVVIEPQRAQQIPGFFEIQKAAIDAGALGCSISGSGPAIFALAANQKAAKEVHKAMLRSAKNNHVILVNSWLSAISKKGAHVVKKMAKQGGR